MAYLNANGELSEPTIPASMFREYLVEERRSHLHAAERIEKRIRSLDSQVGKLGVAVCAPLDKDAQQR